MAAPSTASSRGYIQATLSVVPQPFYLYGGAYSLGSLVESHQIPPYSLYGRNGLSFLGFIPPDNIINSEFIIGIKPGVLMWTLGVTLMNLLTPDWQSASLLNHTFTLVSWSRCQQLPIVHLNRSLRITPF